MEKIIVFCEINNKDKTLKDVSFELISKAFDLKNEAKNLNNTDFEIEAVLVSSFVDKESVLKAYQAGANRFVLIKTSYFDEVSYSLAADAFVEYFNTSKSKVILFPATVFGRQAAPRIASILDTGLVADCTKIEFVLKDNELKLAPTRPTFGSELMATILSKKYPECATIRPKTFKINFDNSKTGEYIEFNSNVKNENKIKLLNTVIDNKEPDSDFSNAKVILAAGFGLVVGKNTEYIEKLKKIAKLTGSKFASTRKLVDYHFTTLDTQIGQTGATVTPELYVAFGISGAIQHVCGMKNSKRIIAINTDKNAPIFKYSDYKVIKDAKNIIDEILENLENK